MVVVALTLAVIAASWTGDRSVSGSLNFSVTVIANAVATIETHDLGGDIVAWVITYDEPDSPYRDERHESLEVLAYTGDSVLFDAGETLTARRYRHDRWPDEIPERYARR